jgi:hypothetical protein
MPAYTLTATDYPDETQVSQIQHGDQEDLPIGYVVELAPGHHLTKDGWTHAGYDYDGNNVSLGKEFDEAAKALMSHYERSSR